MTKPEMSMQTCITVRYKNGTSYEGRTTDENKGYIVIHEIIKGLITSILAYH